MQNKKLNYQKQFYNDPFEDESLDEGSSEEEVPELEEDYAYKCAELESAVDTLNKRVSELEEKCAFLEKALKKNNKAVMTAIAEMLDGIDDRIMNYVDKYSKCSKIKIKHKTEETELRSDKPKDVRVKSSVKEKSYGDWRNNNNNWEDVKPKKHVKSLDEIRERIIKEAKLDETDIPFIPLRMYDAFREGGKVNKEFVKRTIESEKAKYENFGKFIVDDMSKAMDYGKDVGLANALLVIKDRKTGVSDGDLCRLRDSCQHFGTVVCIDSNSCIKITPSKIAKVKLSDIYKAANSAPQISEKVLEWLKDYSKF
jgi:uncharacterized coiled-coil protein SlyX